MRLPVWTRKPMVAETALETRDVVEPASRQDTFLRLLDGYEPALRRLSAAWMDQQADREDLFQEIAVALWQAIPRFRGDSSERTWLYRIAHNVAITAGIRIRSRGRREVAPGEQMDLPSGASTAEQQLLADEKRSLLLAAIRELSAPDRQLIVLHLEGLSYSEIEEVTGWSQAVVGPRLTRIRERLKKLVRAKEAGNGT